MIRFKCPNPQCRRPLSVKDHLAGKKAACPACKKPLLIPARSAAANIEDIAASVLADEPAAAAAEATPPEVITTTCPFCDEQVQLPLDLAGKQAPCPNPDCGRIIKVPRPAVQKRSDWRKAATEGPLGAKENVEKLREAEQAAGIKRGHVSGRALEEAGVLVVQEEPVPTREKIKRWTLVGGIAVGVVALIAFSWISLKRRGRDVSEREPLKEALAWVAPKPSPEMAEKVKKVGPDKKPLFTSDMAAAVHYGAGEFYLGKRDSKQDLEKARTQFVAARNFAKTELPERQILLIYTARTEIGLGGTAAEVQDKTRLDWPDVQKELARTLERIGTLEGRLIALREVGGDLLKIGQDKVAVGLAVEAGGGGGAAKGGPVSPLASQGVAFLLGMKKGDQAAKMLSPPDPKTPLDITTRLAYAEGLARQGNFEEAGKLAQAKGPPLDRFKAALGVASVALQAGRTAEAVANLEDARKLLGGELGRTKVNPLLLWQAARIAAQTGDAAAVKALAAGISDPGCRTQAELEVLRKTMEDKGQPNPDVIDPQFRTTLAYGQALQALARYQTRQGRRDQVLAGIEGEDYPEQFQPFLYLGIALGEQDSHR